jgi:hypothetical protein
MTLGVAFARVGNGNRAFSVRRECEQFGGGPEYWFTLLMVSCLIFRRSMISGVRTLPAAPVEIEDSERRHYRYGNSRANKG